MDTCSGECPGTSTVALIKWLMDHPWPLICSIKVGWKNIIVHVYLRSGEFKSQHCKKQHGEHLP